MRREHPIRLGRIVLLLVALGLLWPADAAGAQDGGDGATTEAPAACTFTKPEAIEANGGEPLGSAIWGRLCQLIDGKATFAEGVEITVAQGGEVLASATTGADGVYILELPGNGTYQVTIDPETLPDGFELTNEARTTLDAQVKLGDQQVAFRLGERASNERDLGDYLTAMAKGLRFGLIIAVAAVGLSLVYGVTGLINFAHAELVTIGAISAFVLDDVGVPFWFTLPLVLVIGGVVGGANDRAIWRPLRQRRMALLSQMVVSIGLSIAVRNALQVWFGARGKPLTGSQGQRVRDYGPFSLTPNDLIIMAICVVVLLAMTFLLRRTRIGTAIRATADNPDLAASSGIAVDRIITLVWVLCGALAGLGGVLYGLSLTVSYDMGFTLLLSLFAAVVLGGLGNAYGAVLGAVVIGVVQETSGLFVDTAYKFVVALAVLILVLLVRPQGILGTRERLG